MLVDTHSHIQFKIFDQDRDVIIQQANDAGVEAIIAVGTSLESSQRAVEIAEKYSAVYAAVGIHPHHVFSYQLSAISYQQEMKEVEILLKNQKVIAIGETGIDTHLYTQTKYQNYQITPPFLALQKEVFALQIKLAIKHQKTLIIHNRGAEDLLLEILEENWDPFLSGRAVFHCCEPNKKLLDFAKKHHVFTGVDGDVTYDKSKQSFIKEVPLELLVLETDSPFFIPEPLRSQGIIRNTPANITQISTFLDNFIGQNVQIMSRNNAQALFKLPS
jgi:TatD DNase family protein